MNTGKKSREIGYITLCFQKVLLSMTQSWSSVIFWVLKNFRVFEVKSKLSLTRHILTPNSNVIQFFWGSVESRCNGIYQLHIPHIKIMALLFLSLFYILNIWRLNIFSSLQWVVIEFCACFVFFLSWSLQLRRPLQQPHFWPIVSMAEHRTDIVNVRS